MTFCYVFSGANIVIVAFLWIFTFLFCHGDIESNTGPTRLKPNYLSLCQISATYLLITFQTFSNTFQSIYNYDFICLSETQLDSSTPFNDNSLEIEGYNPVRMDHPNKVKRGEACIYYRTSLSVTVTGTPYLKGDILFEIAYSNNKILLSAVYR